jgi:hypothetical protein
MSAVQAAMRCSGETASSCAEIVIGAASRRRDGERYRETDRAESRNDTRNDAAHKTLKPVCNAQAAISLA